VKLPPPIERDASPGLADDYSVRLGKGAIARIRLERLSPTRAWIDWVFVPPEHRGEGLAGRLLRCVLADADAAGVAISLEPKACAGLDQRALERWYEGYGFVDSGRRGDLGQVFTRPALPAAATTRRAA
jgi:GNAT superfamily N-acetyltransferase